jgi:DNA-binding FadR family transcriptional regulator
VADEKFHHIIWSIAGNPFLARTLNRLLTPYFALFVSKSIYAELQDPSHVPVVEFHRRLCDALCSGSKVRARKVADDMFNHQSAEWLCIEIDGSCNASVKSIESTQRGRRKKRIES